MFDPQRHHRQSVRWREHDYVAGGTYFVTICTEGRVCLFGEVRDGRMWPNDIGLIVESEWVHTGVMRPDVAIDVFAVMPNHLHGLVTIRPGDVIALDRGLNANPGGQAQGASRAPLRRASGSLGSVIAGFKAASTRRISARSTEPWLVWQRGYYEHVVRNNDDFERIAEYIVTNPERWDVDEENPSSTLPWPSNRAGERWIRLDGIECAQSAYHPGKQLVHGGADGAGRHVPAPDEAQLERQESGESI